MINLVSNIDSKLKFVKLSGAVGPLLFDEDRLLLGLENGHKFFDLVDGTLLGFILVHI